MSPYLVRDGSLWVGETELGLSLRPVQCPRFYDLVTADGVPYEKIAKLQGVVDERALRVSWRG